MRSLLDDSFLSRHLAAAWCSSTGLPARRALAATVNSAFGANRWSWRLIAFHPTKFGPCVHPCDAGSWRFRCCWLTGFVDSRTAFDRHLPSHAVPIVGHFGLHSIAVSSSRYVSRQGSPLASRSRRVGSICGAPIFAGLILATRRRPQYLAVLAIMPGGFPSSAS